MDQQKRDRARKIANRYLEGIRAKQRRDRANAMTEKELVDDLFDNGPAEDDDVPAVLFRTKPLEG